MTLCWQYIDAWMWLTLSVVGFDANPNQADVANESSHQVAHTTMDAEFGVIIVPDENENTALRLQNDIVK